jgi:hypothetical protein
VADAEEGGLGRYVYANDMQLRTGCAALRRSRRNCARTGRESHTIRGVYGHRQVLFRMARLVNAERGSAAFKTTFRKST